jgi:5-amino-6-(5-phosphoribosylamino)uracil reductase
MSVDGFIDDTGPVPLVLSGPEDLDRVDAVRAGCDAILVGAATVRRDDPRLVLKSPDRRAARVRRGAVPDPLKVTLTGGGDLDPSSRFFTEGTAGKLVYAPSGVVAKLGERLATLATVVDLGPQIALPALLEDLAARGVGRLLVEGGGSLHTQLLAGGLADELHLAIAPFFVGDPAAPRFVQSGRLPWHGGARMRLAEVRQVGDVALLRYLLGTASDG